MSPGRLPASLSLPLSLSILVCSESKAAFKGQRKDVEAEGSEGSNQNWFVFFLNTRTNDLLALFEFLPCSALWLFIMICWRDKARKEAENKMPNKLHEKRQRRQDLPQHQQEKGRGEGSASFASNSQCAQAKRLTGFSSDRGR